MTDAPAPMTPPDCDLRAFRDMPLDIGRFSRSDLVTEEEPEAVLAAILLWGAAWHEVPAASVPDNDKWLAKAAGYGRAVDAWMRVREGALRGFVRCSDGRLYNRTLAEKANTAWESRLRYEWQKAGDRHRKSQRDLPEAERTKFVDFDDWKAGRLPEYSAGQDDLFRRNDPDIPAEIALKGREGKGREGSLLDTQPNGCVASGPDEGQPEGEQEEADPPAARPAPMPKPQHFVEVWNELAGRIGRPTIKVLTDSRRQVLKARIANHPVEDFQTVFAKVEGSDFLCGRTPRWGGVTFDWLIKQANFIKVLEGNYD